MEITSVSPVTGAQVTSTSALRQTDGADGSDVEVAPDGVATADADVSPESSGRGRGVVRNLLAGHFKGVAELRLRVNFAGEIAAAEAASAEAARTEVHARIEGFADEAAAFAEPHLDGATDDARGKIEASLETFGADLAEQADALDAGAELDLAPLAAALRSGFDRLIEALTRDDRHEAPDATAGVASADDPFSDLRDAFESLVQGIAGVIDGILRMPPLSESGNRGHAYEELLASFHDAFEDGESSDDPALLDTVA